MCIVYIISKLFRYSEHRWLGHLRQRDTSAEPEMASLR
jgi:hypothetical protein